MKYLIKTIVLSIIVGGVFISLNEGAGFKLSKNVSLETRELIKACWDGDEKSVSHYIQKGADLHVRSGHGGYSCLHMASESGHASVVKLLIKHGSKVNAVSRGDETPLHLAAEKGHLDTMKVLVKAGAKINAKDDRDRTPLHCAAKQGNRATISLLLSNGAKINAKSNQRPREKTGITPLYYAVLNGNKDAVRLLIEKGADVTVRIRKSATLLHTAAMADNKDVVLLLIKSGINVDSLNQGNSTPLHLSAIKGTLDIAKLLIDKGADVNADDGRSGYRPLSYAAMHGHVALGKMLIDNGAQIDFLSKQDSTREPPKSHLPANFPKDTKNRYSPLFISVANGHAEFVKMLIENGVDIKAFQGGWTILSWAASKGASRDVLQLLIKNGEDVNRQNSFGYHESPIGAAASRGKADVVAYLIENGADYKAKMKIGQTPLHSCMTSSEGAVKCATLLIEKGVDVNAKDASGNTPLYRAVSGSSEEMLKLLIKNGAKVDIRNNKGATPLHYATLSSGTRSLQFLVNMNIDLDVKDSEGRTALDYAVKYKRKAQAAILRAGAKEVKKDITEDSNLNLTQKEKDEALWRLVYTSSKLPDADLEDKFNSLVFAGADIRATRNGRKETMLQNAVYNGSLKMIQLIVEKGGDIDADKCLIYAAGRSDYSICKYLLDKKADVTVTGYQGITPILAALRSRNRDEKVIALLLEHGAGRGSIHEAIELGDVKLVKEFIAKNVDLNARDGRAYTPLHSASNLDKAEICGLLLDAGADASKGLRASSTTPLEWACRKGYTNSAMVFLKRLPASEIDMRAKVLPAAMISKNIDLCKAVLNSCDNPSKVIESSKHLDYVIANASPEFVVLLTDMGYHPPLWIAALTGDLKAMMNAVERGENIDNPASIQSGATPLHWAIMKGQPKAVEFLLNAKADVNSVMKDNKLTPLHTAAEHGEHVIITMLLAKGAKIDAQMRGETPLDRAVRNGKVRAVEVLLDAGADINILPDKYSGKKGRKREPLYTRTSDKELARYLKKRGSK